MIIRTSMCFSHAKYVIDHAQVQKNLSGGGSNFFSLMSGERLQIPLKAGHHWPASDMPFEWRFAAGGPIMAQH